MGLGLWGRKNNTIARVATREFILNVRSDRVNSLSLAKSINLLVRPKLAELVVLPPEYMVEGNLRPKSEE
jgi:hypothetical protein